MYDKGRKVSDYIFTTKFMCNNKLYLMTSLLYCIIKKYQMTTYNLPNLGKMNFLVETKKMYSMLIYDAMKA